jgi:hypothetical protein
MHLRARGSLGVKYRSTGRDIVWGYAMLQKLAEHISDAWLHAAEWEERARQSTNESQRQGSLRLAKAYSHLAKSYPVPDSLLLPASHAGPFFVLLAC